MAKKGLFRKRCKNCSKEYGLLAFLSLPFPANGRGEAVLGGVPMICRNCTCGSTLAIHVTDVEQNDGASA